MSASSVLFDAPGPRARRRTVIVTVVSLAAIAALIGLALRQFSLNGQLSADRWTPFAQAGYVRYLFGGVEGTLKAAAVGAAVSFPAGAVLALLRLSRNRLINLVSSAYIELFRSIPLLLLIYAFLLALPGLGLNLPIFGKLVVPIILVNTAILAEVFRAGINALDRGQSEAAAAIGLRYWHSMRLVVLPQAVRIIIPTLVTSLVSLLKDTTLGYVVSYPELMKTATNLTAVTHLLIQTYLIVGVLYVVVNVALSALARYLERRLRRGRRSAGGAGGQGGTGRNDVAVAVIR